MAMFYTNLRDTGGDVRTRSPIDGLRRFRAADDHC